MVSSRFAFLSLAIGAVGYVNASPFNNADSAAHSLRDVKDCNQPPVCSGSDCSSTADIDNALTEYAPEISVFWGGRYNGVTIEPKAVECAKSRKPTNAATIGMVLCQDDKIKMPANGSDPLWDYASEAFAKQAKGGALAAIGEALYERAAFFNIEFPALRKNANIKSVVSIDVGTTGCKELCTWYCRSGETCPNKSCIIQTVPGNTPPSKP